MSTLPFLLSVADELDNINSQSYLDDFGLGFHPHRQFYRTPTIQLSLPAGTDWMQQDSRHQSRYRSSCRHYGERNSQLSLAIEESERSDEAELDQNVLINKEYDFSHKNTNNLVPDTTSGKRTRTFLSTVTPNANPEVIVNIRDELEDSIRNSKAISSVSKKCSKNYYRQKEMPVSVSTTSTSSVIKTLPIADATCSSTGSSLRSKDKCGIGMGIRLNSKCLHGNNSSSDESLQKVSSSIEFLTCFLLKKSRSNKTSSMGSGITDGKKA